MQEPKMFQADIAVCIAEPEIAMIVADIGLWELPVLCSWAACIAG